MVQRKICIMWASAMGTAIELKHKSDLPHVKMQL